MPNIDIFTIQTVLIHYNAGPERERFHKHKAHFPEGVRRHVFSTMSHMSCLSSFFCHLCLVVHCLDSLLSLTIHLYTLLALLLILLPQLCLRDCTFVEPVAKHYKQPKDYLQCWCVPTSKYCVPYLHHSMPQRGIGTLNIDVSVASGVTHNMYISATFQQVHIWLFDVASASLRHSVILTSQ